MKYARRCAVFGPIPGSLPSSSTSCATGSASVAERVEVTYMALERQVQAAGYGTHTLALQRLCLLDGVGHRAKHQILQHFDIVRIYHVLANTNGTQLDLSDNCGVFLSAHSSTLISLFGH